jgi:hypothetical protein
MVVGVPIDRVVVDLSADVSVRSRRVVPQDANRALAVLKTLNWVAHSGGGWRGIVYEVWVERRVNMAGGPWGFPRASSPVLPRLSPVLTSDQAAAYRKTLG